MSSNIQNQQRPGSSMGIQPMRSQPPHSIFNPPPPYRAPPMPAGGNIQPIQQQFSPMPSKNLSAPFSKFNSSEPNVSGNPNLSHQPPPSNNGVGLQNGLAQPTSPTVNNGGYRHTINHENSQQVQHGLRNMMQQPQGGGQGSAGHKHSTLDSAGQSMALNHLRNSGLALNQQQSNNTFQPNKPPTSTTVTNGDSTYISADNLRDAANRLFTRNHGDRSSFGTLTTTQQNQQSQQQQQMLQQHMQRFSSVRGNVTPNTTNYSNVVPTSTPATAEEKRNSFTNQSFRKALGSQQQTNGNQQLSPTSAPLVPPKPNSNVGSKNVNSKDNAVANNDPASMHDQDTTLDAELKNILRAGGNSANLSFLLNNSGQRLSVGPNGTPPLPALSPGPMPSQLFAQIGSSLNDDQSANLESIGDTSNAQRNGSSYFKQQGNANTGKIKFPNQQQKAGSNRPDLLGDAPEATPNSADKVKSLLANPNSNILLRRANNMENIHLIKDPKTGKVIGGKKLPIPVTDVNGMTPGAKDLEQMMGMVGGMTDITSEDYDDNDGASTMIDVGDATAIRRQLDGLENMYTEVLRLLGLRKFGRQYHELPGGPNNPSLPSKSHHIRRNKGMYGSMSSLPSVSSIGSRHLYKEKQHHSHQRKDVSASANKRPGSAGGNREKNYNKRFQRLESHVVTLARSVANLSSEIRSQQVLVQEVEALKAEMHQLRMSQPNSNSISSRNPSQSHPNLQFDSGRNMGSGYNNSSAFKTSMGFYPISANRVRKLTHFFGEEPPLVKQFLKSLGYEKYASIFEEAKIGMLELPYLTEDRLEKLGIPTGPRLRILQEAKASVYGIKPTHVTPSGTHNSIQTMPSYPSSGGQQHNNNPSAAATVGGGVSSNPHEPNYNVYIL